MTIVCMTAAALALAVLFVVLAPHEYTAVTQILIDPTDLRAVGNEATPASQMSDAALLQVESQVRVLTSDTVLRRVVSTERLEHDPEFARGPSLLSKLIGKDTIPGGVSLAALNELKRRVVVKRAERTFVVDVAVNSRDPSKAVRLANAIAQAYLTEQTQVRADAARQVSQTLSARLKELQDRVRESEERVEAYKARNNLVAANGQLVTEQQLAELSNQLGAARVHTAEVKARLDQVELVQHNKDEMVGAFPEAIQSPTITQLRGQYAEIQRREAEQLTTLGDRHPAAIEIQAQAERLRAVIDNEVNRVALSARAEYESAKSSEQTLADSLETLKRKALAGNDAMVGLRELDRDVQASRSVYEAFLVRAREAGAQEQIDTKNIRILSKADLPQRRSSPPPNLLLALGAMMLGAAAGTGIVLLRSPVENPRRPGAGGAWRRIFAAATLGLWPASTSPAIPILAVLPAADVSFGLNAADDPASSFGKAIRKVYDEVQASHTSPHNPSVLVVASDAEDDSATVALAIAAVAATTRRVLLIDADLERRTLSAIDARPSEAGLVDVAVGRRQLADVITRDPDTNINLVSFVASHSRRDRRIDDADVKRAFDQTKRFDLVIVAAVDAGGNPSIGFFAGLVDHIVLAVRADEHDEAAIERFAARLGLDARKVRGVVLTGGAAA